MFVNGYSDRHCISESAQILMEAATETEENWLYRVNLVFPNWVEIKKETQDFPVNRDLGFINAKLFHHPLRHDASEMQKPVSSEINL